MHPVSAMQSALRHGFCGPSSPYPFTYSYTTASSPSRDRVRSRDWPELALFQIAIGIGIVHTGTLLRPGDACQARVLRCAKPAGTPACLSPATNSEDGPDPLPPSPLPLLLPPSSFLLSPFSFLPPSSLLLVCPAASHQPPIDCVPKKRVPSCWREPLCVSAYFFDTQKTRPFVLSLNVTGPPERRPGLCVLILPFLVLRWPCPDFFLSAKSESLPDVRTGSRWQRGFQCLAESRPACCPVASSVRQAPHRLCGPIARSVDFHTPTAIIKTRV